MYSKLYLILLVVYLLLLVACNTSTQKEKNTAFSKLNTTESGIDFNNVISENDSVNLINNEYAYMGGGVGIVDINNDGLADIFFSGNQVSSKLYLNRGNNHFEDITKTAGVSTKTWCTGVSIVDINNDGYQDIYVSVSGSVPTRDRKNLLFINNKNKTFTEQASEYGVADSGYSTQAVFLDFDKDGDLDMYLVNHLLQGPNPNNITRKDLSGSSLLNDHLYLNEGVNKHLNHPVYKDVSLQAGIKEDGYGLGVAVSDFNNDSWPDIYVTNDYISNDLLWINNRNGTFTNQIAASLNHQSYSSMGVDAADINNDGLPDIVTLDMQPEYNQGKKEMFSFLTYERYEMERKEGYEPEFMRNMLQLNNGNLTIADTVLPRFSEIGQLAGMSETDWSWSILMADFDNDGWKDMHITNGIGRDLINGDFVLYRAQTPDDPVAGEAGRKKKLQQQLASLGEVPLQNYLLHNNKDYTFSNQNNGSGMEELSISNGAAFADLDNDGDLDIVVNNINLPAFVYINNARSGQGEDSLHNYFSFDLIGDSLNKNAFGAKVYITSNGNTQFFEQSPVRGYASSVDKRIFAGLGNAAVADVKIIWPDGKVTLLDGVKSNQLLSAKSMNGSISDRRSEPVNRNQLFTEIASTAGIKFKHQETFFNDYSFQRLLPQKYSQLGPFMSVADVNGDGLEDFFIGGAFKQSGKIYLQQSSGEFVGKDLLKGNKFEEDLGSVFFDVNGDHLPDLFVVSGGNEFEEGSKYYRPRLYLNDGKGNFAADENAIPVSVNTSAQAITTLDIDEDGDLDLVIAGRVSTQYPASPKSYILQNDKGVFHDVTGSVCPEFQRAGMITAMIAADFDGDKKTDLVVAGEWMPVRFFKNMGGYFIEVTKQSGLSDNNGMWRSLLAADIDMDGDLDFVAGNLGINNKYHVAPQKPMVLYAKDLDNNGSIDPVIGYYIKDNATQTTLYPSVSLNQFAEQVPSVKKQYLFYKDYAKATMHDIFRPGEDETFLQLNSNELHSCWLENFGNGKFKKHWLPAEAQFAPVNAIVCQDIDHDGREDILLAGNEYQADVMTGRYDASYGCFLKGNGKGDFTFIKPAISGFALKGDVKDLKIIQTYSSGMILLAAVNNERVKAFLVKR